MSSHWVWHSLDQEEELSEEFLAEPEAMLYHRILRELFD